jgi:hypothetical protein
MSVTCRVVLPAVVSRPVVARVMIRRVVLAGGAGQPVIARVVSGRVVLAAGGGVIRGLAGTSIRGMALSLCGVRLVAARTMPTVGELDFRLAVAGMRVVVGDVIVEGCREGTAAGGGKPTLQEFQLHDPAMPLLIGIHG